MQHVKSLDIDIGSYSEKLSRRCFLRFIGLAPIRRTPDSNLVFLIEFRILSIRSSGGFILSNKVFEVYLMYTTEILKPIIKNKHSERKTKIILRREAKISKF